MSDFYHELARWFAGFPAYVEEDTNSTWSQHGDKCMEMLDDYLVWAFIDGEWRTIAHIYTSCRGRNVHYTSEFSS